MGFDDNEARFTLRVFDKYLKSSHQPVTNSSFFSPLPSSAASRSRSLCHYYNLSSHCQPNNAFAPTLNPSASKYNRSCRL